VPIVVAIDEYGIVRSTRPRMPTFKTDFLDREFPAPKKQPATVKRASLASLRRQAEKQGSAADWRYVGDSIAVFGDATLPKGKWGTKEQAEQAIEAYQRASKISPHDGDTLFRLGVAYRMRFDSGQGPLADFGRAVDYWGRALAVNPNQYIWRRRIQQYGPRLQKPYPFYDWVATAQKEIKERGEKPIALSAPPSGAEIASPSRRFPSPPAAAVPPDPDGKINRDAKSLVRCAASVVPARVRAGGTGRLHLILKPSGGAHWNNEAEPTVVWIEAPEGWRLTKRLLKTGLPRKAESTEQRHLELEFKVPREAKGTHKVEGYALYYVCEESGGQCLYLRQDFSASIELVE